jgi:hypothetical protein
LTQLSAQQSLSVKPQDTIKCYNLVELQQIAATLIDCEACDTLLSVANFKIKNREDLIKEKDFELSQLSGQNLLKDTIIEHKDDTINQLNESIISLQQQRKWIGIGLGSTTLLLGGLLYGMILTR